MLLTWVKPRHSSLKTLELLQVTRNQLSSDLCTRSLMVALPPACRAKRSRNKMQSGKLQE